MEPLIYTIKGNLPIASLSYSTEWDSQEHYIKFTEIYRDSTGEIVRSSAHVYDKHGIEAKAAVANLG